MARHHHAIAAWAIAALLAGRATAAPAHRLACPAEAPAAWHLPRPAPLVEGDVLNQPNGEPIDESAPPYLAPDRGFTRGGVRHNIWIMEDRPGWSDFVWCRYRGSPRTLRLKATGLRRCEQTVRHAVQTMACD